MLLISILHNKIFFSVAFEPKKFARKLAENRKNCVKFFGSKSTKKKILSCKVNMRSKLYEIKILSYVVKNWSLWSKFTCSKKVFWFFSKGLRFRILSTIDYWTTYMPSGIQICIPLFWGIFFAIRFQSNQAVAVLEVHSWKYGPDPSWFQYSISSHR